MGSWQVSGNAFWWVVWTLWFGPLFQCVVRSKMTIESFEITAGKLLQFCSQGSFSSSRFQFILISQKYNHYLITKTPVNTVFSKRRLSILRYFVSVLPHHHYRNEGCMIFFFVFNARQPVVFVPCGWFPPPLIKASVLIGVTSAANTRLRLCE